MRASTIATLRGIFAPGLCEEAAGILRAGSLPLGPADEKASLADLLALEREIPNNKDRGDSIRNCRR